MLMLPDLSKVRLNDFVRLGYWLEFVERTPEPESDGGLAGA